jgi:hypothetical protein
MQKPRKFNMQKLFIIAALAMALPVLSQAQEAPRTEFFGGYSYMRTEEISPPRPAQPEDRDLNGYNVSGAVTIFKKYLSVKVDISGHFGAVLPNIPQLQIKQGRTLFLAGPQITFRKNERFQPFAHVLVGAVRLKVESDRVNVDGADTGFAMAFGGGVDVKTPLGKKVTVRLLQADYVRTKLEVATLGNLRVSAGIVLRFGTVD